MIKNKKLRILIVDDEPAIRDFLKPALVAQGYKVFEASSGAAALQKVPASHPDVIVLDIGLPDLDGFTVTKNIRKRSRVPIIILSVRNSTADKIAALDVGADDYLEKPFSTDELLARIRAVLRRLAPLDQKEILKVGSLTMDLSARQVKMKNKEIKLTPTEYAVLKLLMTNSGRVISHKELLGEIWNSSAEMEGIYHLLRVTISNLRSKLEPDHNKPAYIITEPGIGYRLGA